MRKLHRRHHSQAAAGSHKPDGVHEEWRPGASQAGKFYPRFMGSEQSDLSRLTIESLIPNEWGIAHHSIGSRETIRFYVEEICVT